MLSDSDLARMRATAHAARPDSIQVVKATATPDEAGGSSVLWEAEETPYAARLVPTGGEEAEIANRLRLTVDFTLDLPPDFTALPADRLIFEDGREVEIVHIRKGGAWAMGTRVFCREVN